MTSSTFFPFLPILSKPNPNPNPNYPSTIKFYNHSTIFLKLNNNKNNSSKKALNFNNNNNNSNNNLLSVPCYATTVVGTTKTASSEISGNKLKRLVSEFESLKEPVDRVKRLLDYAGLLQPMDESGRLPGNRVKGCTTQVWIEAKLDEKGRMRFRGDSDSEITKGFIACLIWLHDGLEPDEVIAIKPEDLAAMNVGIYGSRVQSRVNSWINILISMQNRTKALAADRKRTIANSQDSPLGRNDPLQRPVARIGQASSIYKSLSVKKMITIQTYPQDPLFIHQS